MNRDEDYFTNTIDGAAAFESKHTEPDFNDEYEDEDEDAEADFCGCSDWACPCGGKKRGGL